ncbi:hypothetical protein LZQ00_08275 [Sphingobacterium sp. SRCM116780]|uniref:hypothetical protein n=1 Tax=Sphingobacterium sp. SRCM116780 TaxID=2907623 RepID=UPI001F24CB24|nr:hypothetical protein [Sphingobacterium sp. SRCM116780]UIR57803.1 hypothetical protein LZQ00_08275 [Sphingobacterium sp. SRCM116780]
MKITDLKGHSIEVTDLNKAIKQARSYKDYYHTDPSFADFDKRQNEYWKDMYEKLITIKKMNYGNN